VSRNLDRRHLRTKNRQKRTEISHLPVLIAADGNSLRCSTMIVGFSKKLSGTR
jgi:hypothetical protein